MHRDCCFNEIFALNLSVMTSTGMQIITLIALFVSTCACSDMCIVVLCCCSCVVHNTLQHSRLAVLGWCLTALSLLLWFNIIKLSYYLLGLYDVLEELRHCN